MQPNNLMHIYYVCAGTYGLQTMTDIPQDDISKILDWDNDERRLEIERERLRQRARQYATNSGNDDVASDQFETLLTFNLGTERYGIDVMLVRGVRAEQKITPVPGVPSFYRGVINMRGQIVTVLDLRYLLNVGNPESHTPPTEVMITQANNLRLGLLAHKVNGVESIPRSEINPIDHLPYSQGVTAERLIVLNLQRLFEDPRLMVGVMEA